jgi:peptidoglycan/LPS O-acetylase OafA/YrhL
LRSVFTLERSHGAATVTNEIRPLTGIRGFAAYWVLAYHYSQDLYALIPGFALLEPIFARGGMGVDIFFVLSGFVISYVYRIEARPLAASGYGKFVVNRVARIYPAYAFCLGILLCIVLADRITGRDMADPQSYPLSSMIWHLLMMQAWPFVPANWSNWNTPAWSVSAEWFAYLFLFPASLALAKVKCTSRVYGLLLLALLVTYFFLAERVELGQFAIVTQIAAQYGAGVVAYLWYKANPSKVEVCAKYYDLVVSVFIACVALSSWHPSGHLAVLCLTPLLIIGATRESSWISRLLATKFVRYVGVVSYSLYLIHAITHRILHVVLPVESFVDASFLVRGLLFVAYLAIPLGMAAAIYHFVEEPCRIRIRRLA